MILAEQSQGHTPVQHDESGQPDRSASASADVNVNVNVGQGERLLSAVAGGALAYLGLRARSGMGLLAAGLGAAMIHRGYTGHCAAYAAMGIDTAHGGDSTRPSAEPE